MGLSDRDEPPDRADDAFSSRAMSLLFCEVIELLLEVTDSEMLNTRFADEVLIAE